MIYEYNIGKRKVKVQANSQASADALIAERYPDNDTTPWYPEVEVTITPLTEDLVELEDEVELEADEDEE